MVAESPDAVIGMRPLDLAKCHGFRFRRLAPGPDGPLWGGRETEQWRETVYLSGFWAPDSCSATPALQVPPTRSRELLVTERVPGDALNVLNTVVSHRSSNATRHGGRR